MSVRLPITNRDENSWGDLLNEFLLVAHNPDGTLKPITDPQLSATTFVVASNEIRIAGTRTADYYCDGVNDDVEINQALAAAKLLGGGKVILTTGAFTIGATIEIPSNMILTGEGLATIVTFATDVGNDIMFTNDADWTFGQRHATGNTNIELSNMSIDGDKDNRAAGADSINTILFNTVSNLVITKLKVVNGWTSAIRAEFCTYGKVLHNDVDLAADDGIAINEGCFEFLVFGNRVTRSGTGKSYGGPMGIEVQDGALRIVVIGNFVEDCGGGIEVSTHVGKDACENVTIQANTITDCSTSIYLLGITGTQQKKISVIGNQILNTGALHYWGVRAEYIDDLIITSNQIDTAVQAGKIHYCNRITVSGNTCICGEAVDNGEKAWIVSGTTNYLTFNDNMISNFGWKGIEISGTVNYMRVLDNQIIGCTFVTGACIRWDTPITSSNCIVDNNVLVGTHKTYDEATDTYDVLVSGWAFSSHSL